MTRIKPRTRGKHLVRRMTRLDQQNDETLQAYAAFIGEDADYVLNQLVDAILARDRDFVKWRTEHAAPIVSRVTRRGRRRAPVAAAGHGHLNMPTVDTSPSASTMVS